MASAVASKVAEVPKPVFLMDVIASPSASGKTVVTSVRHLFSAGVAPPRSSSHDGVKGSTGEREGIKDSTGQGDGVKGSTEGNGVKDSTGENATADPRPERDIPIPKLFATRDVLDRRFPDAAMRDLLQALALAEDGGGAASKTGYSAHGCWAKADGDAVQLKVAMPGLGKEHVKMRVEKNALVIKGEGDKDSEGDAGDKVPARYSYRIELPSSHAFKMDQIKAEMKNGVLMVTMPKIKDEERKDVFEIKVE